MRKDMKTDKATVQVSMPLGLKEEMEEKYDENRITGYITLEG